MITTNQSRWVWVRFALAALLAFLAVAAVLPNVGHFVVDNTTTPPTSRMVQSARDALPVIGIAMVPLLLILVGALWIALLEFIGWVLLVALVVMVFIG